MFYAVKRQMIKRDGGYVWVQPGDEVPEAGSWPNLKALIRQRFIRETKFESKWERMGKFARKEAAREEAKKEAVKIKISKPAPEPVPAPADKKTEAEKVKTGPGTCKKCGKDFQRIQMHKCNK
jgi:hypothetical protein